MDWMELLGAVAIGGGAFLGAEALGSSRGKHKQPLKMAAAVLALCAGLVLLGGLWQFGWVRNPPTAIAILAAGALLFQGARAVKDLLDGEPDRQARIAVLILPLILVMGLGWLKTNAVDMGKDGADHVTNQTVK